MQHILEVWPMGVSPVAIYAYLDKVQVWLKRPAAAKEVARLRKLCASLHEQAGPAEWDRTFQQRLQLYQPQGEALAWLARREDVHLNYVECSLDWIFGNETDRDDAYAFACRHHVKKRHGNQKITFVGEGGVTRYTASRQAANLLASYRDLPSKVTGEVYCVHFDWRTKGREALRRMGVNSVADLIELNLRSFWIDRLLFFRVNPDRLGRLYWTHRRSRGRRRPWIIPFYHVDRRTGAMIVQALGSTQAVIDELGPRLSRQKLRNCLEAIDVGHLLPQRDDAFL